MGPIKCKMSMPDGFKSNLTVKIQDESEKEGWWLNKIRILLSAWWWVEREVLSSLKYELVVVKSKSCLAQKFFFLNKLYQGHPAQDFLFSLNLLHHQAL